VSVSSSFSEDHKTYISYILSLLAVIVLCVFVWRIESRQRNEQHQTLLEDKVWAEQFIDTRMQKIYDDLMNLDAMLSPVDQGYLIGKLMRFSPDLIWLGRASRDKDLWALRTFGHQIPEFESIVQQQLDGLKHDVPRSIMWLDPSLISEHDVLISIAYQTAKNRWVIAGFSGKKWLKQSLPLWLHERYHVSLWFDQRHILSLEPEFTPDKFQTSLVLSGPWFLAMTSKQSKFWLQQDIIAMALTLMIALCSMGYAWRTRQKLLRMRAQSEQQSRMLVLGEMGSSIAHEINQPLTTTINYLEGVKLRLGQGHELQPIIHKISTQIERIREIIYKIRHLVKHPHPNVQEHTVGEMVDRIHDLVYSDLRLYHITFYQRLEQNLPSIYVDSILLEQALCNLIRNAIDAVKDLNQEERKAISLTIVRDSQREGYLLWMVQDYGSGIPRVLQNQLFDVMVTTKNEGLGLGLNICRSIIESHGGSLWLDGSDDQGTRFCFSLPYAKSHD
jgi:signal transduction histidine kinase